MSVRTGVEVLLKDPGEYVGSKGVGLITNPTGVTRELASTIDVFHIHPGIDLVALFGSEHGVRGDIQDALPVDHHVDEATGLPVYSLYGEGA